MRHYIKGLFEVPTNTNMRADFEPALSIDSTNRIVEGIQSLRELLGITILEPMRAGDLIRRYQTTVTIPDGVGGKKGKVAEGDIIPLSKTTRVELTPIQIEYKKVRKDTTIEAIQANRFRSLYESDDLLVKEMRKELLADFYGVINGGTGTATAGANVQKAAANAWAAVVAYYEDTNATPVFFMHPETVAAYLGEANITTQDAFGVKYLANFLGLGVCIINSKVAKNAVLATAEENLHLAYIERESDGSNTFGLTYDESGLVGMTHTLRTDNATVESFMLTGTTFYAQDESGIFTATIA